MKMIVAAVFLIGAVSGAPIVVHNTGVNASNVVLPIASATPFWTLLSEPAGAGYAIGSTPFRYFNNAYYADNSVSGWVSPGANGNAGAMGNYTYQLAVDLTGFDPATAVLSGTFGTDNDGSIALNGSAPVATQSFAGFSSATPFTISSGFVAGINFVKVTLDNGGDPTAFRVQFASASATPLGGPVSGVPEPGTLALLIAGLVPVLALRRRRARS